MQVFFLHFAGGNCFSYNFLTSALTDVECNSLELAGRGKRALEPLTKDLGVAVTDYLRQIQSKRNKEKDYIIYGHSMGATLGLLVAGELEKSDDPPNGVLFTGNPGPDIKDKKATKRYLLDDKSFKKELYSLGGIPDEVFSNKELFDYFSPILRADFEVIEKEKITAPILNCPINVMMGSEEEFVNEIENWKNFTRSSLTLQVLNGGHFFIFNNGEKIIETIKNMV